MAGDQPLAGVVRGADLGQVLGIEQAHLQRAVPGELLDRRGAQAGDPAHARRLFQRLDPGAGDHAPVPDHDCLGDAELAPDHLHCLDEGRRVAGVAREHPHRHRAAVAAGEQPVLDLRLAALAVAGMPERRQFAVAAFHPRARQVEQRHPAAGQMAASQFGLDIVLVFQQPVHRLVGLVRGGPGHPQVAPQSAVAPPADRGQLRGRAGHPGHDQRIGQVPLPARRPQQRREAQMAGHLVHGGHVPMRQRPGHLHRGARVDNGLAGQHQPHRLDRIVWQVRQVRQGLLADLAAIPVGTAQQVPLVDPLGPVFQNLMATRRLYMHRARSPCHGHILSPAGHQGKHF